MNISQANIKINNQSNIDILITRAPKNTKVSQLEARIKALEERGISADVLSAAIVAELNKKDFVTNTQLNTKLSGYYTKTETDSKVEDSNLTSTSMTQEVFDSLTTKNPNCIYVVN